ncbi:terpene cyclase/mutase family protein [Verrucomicrobiaceae bacterium R5-34]|uniref:Terpene cyclase/mutase family protein n=1 Tax=Oceaniferula flava TaxID=2800421 RepID=A0AAE2VBL7_9BACT|nr:terpene cyclase/mutase family protein [Oceaniferula flavus]MBK1830574.1 terpene cyclase/mutase family protein [Verrucomicrobiaceae bacterium R5-34]MBK1854670.1 terpene cyclase/mutase family protein [Oceaniferula flavus]MBM1135976.1 terpene cyclase/mutase family protein [Oceaniferula flavus]
MKTLATILTLASVLPLSAQSNQPNPHTSIKLEMKRAIERGNAYLKSKQHEDGYWGESKYPAFTALAVTAAMRSPSYEKSEHIEKAYKWILSNQHADGGIYVKGLATYNTATSLTALVAAGKKEYHPAILQARRFLINQQTDWDTKGETDNVFDGGIGYGGSYPHSDLSNTHLAIEALRLSRSIAQDEANGKQPELNWDAAITFISRTQNLKETSDVEGISDDGSFNYYPGDSKAVEKNVNPDGTKTLRGYGSMSYAGLLSMIYADLDASDPRVAAAKQWLSENYTVKENPGLATKDDPSLGQQGLYYYYQTMAKALSAANLDNLELKDGEKADWRTDLANQLLKRQREDGSWINAENSRWWENDAILVTCYAVLSLEQIYHSIPE